MKLTTLATASALCEAAVSASASSVINASFRAFSASGLFSVTVAMWFSISTMMVS